MYGRGHPRPFGPMKDLMTVARERQQVNDAIRQFFRSQAYTEVETPILVRSPDVSPTLTPFETEAIEADGTRYPGALITSPEFSMKKLLGSECDRIFTITKVFRNREHFGGVHNPEFTMIEWYRQDADYHSGMDETEGVVRAVFEAFGKQLPAFNRWRIHDLFEKHVGMDLSAAGVTELKKACETHGIHTDPSDNESDLFYRLFLDKVEPLLADAPPTFIYDFPLYQAALAAATPDGKYAQRFELFLGGVELCNAFTELTDAVEQRRRFEHEIEERKRIHKSVFPIDEELLSLLPSVRQKTFGNALGIDRLHMLAAGRASIEDVLLFPAKHLFSPPTNT